MPATRPRRRPAFWVGLLGLAVTALLGAVAGWQGALGLALLYLALSAGWGVLTTRTWWGPMTRGHAAAVGSGALVALIVVAATAPGPDDGAPPTGDARPQVSATVEPTDAPTETAAPTASSEPSADDRPEKKPGKTKAQQEKTAEEEKEQPAARQGTALAAVATLEVKGRAPKTGYDRDQFGPAWADVDHNGCDTRNDVLRRDLDDVTTRAGTHGCVVLTGTFDDPFSGTRIDFRRGQSTSSLVQIDHLVALSDAWQKGAQRLSAEQRRQLANDPLNLMAADGSLNASKGDGDAATWLPPHKKFRCTYVARQVAVKHSYNLWVTSAERDAMRRVLSTCPDKKLPAGDVTEPAAPLLPETATTQEPAQQPTKKPATKPEPATGSGGSSSTSYENCDAVRAAGAAPIHRGEPGYESKLDRDGDGVGCE